MGDAPGRDRRVELRAVEPSPTKLAYLGAARVWRKVTVLTLKIHAASNRDRLAHQSRPELTRERGRDRPGEEDQMCAPTPEREISSAAGGWIARAAVR